MHVTNLAIFIGYQTYELLLMSFKKVKMCFGLSDAPNFQFVFELEDVQN